MKPFGTFQKLLFQIAILLYITNLIRACNENSDCKACDNSQFVSKLVRAIGNLYKIKRLSKAKAKNFKFYKETGPQTLVLYMEIGLLMNQKD